MKKTIEDFYLFWWQLQTYGILLEFAARIQINMMVQPDPDIRYYNKKLISELIVVKFHFVAKLNK